MSEKDDFEKWYAEKFGGNKPDYLHLQNQLLLEAWLASRSRTLADFEEKHMDYLAFLQEQIEVRESEKEGEIGKNERYTTELLMLTMAWQEHLRLYYGLYPALDSQKPLGSGKNLELWVKVEEYRRRKLSAIKSEALDAPLPKVKSELEKEAGEQPRKR